MTAEQSALCVDYLRYVVAALHAARARHDAMAATLTPLVKNAGQPAQAVFALQENDLIRQMLTRLADGAAAAADGANAAALGQILDLDILPRFGGGEEPEADQAAVELF